MKSGFNSIVLGCCAALVMAGANPVIEAQAADMVMATEYSISFAGIPVARSKFRTTMNGDIVSVTGNLATAGLAAVFDSTNATSVSSGKISKNGVESQSFELDYKSGERVRSTRINFKGGNVTKSVVNPERPPNPQITPIVPAHLKGVVDPFLASMVSAPNPADVCKRTIKIFDGLLRINLVLRPAGGEPYVVGKLKGEGIRCAARYEPVSGHKPASGTVKYMADGERATILFGAIPGTTLYAPVKASIKMKAGTVSIRATKFAQIIE
jgi:Protein of unknown function (DUF3108)